ncbi:MAG: protein kinase [Thermoanaerobaculia bacterium]|nr:protein kinase [Thermoanaerobaculia bacterium]
MIGRTIGEYKIEERLGSGGMSELYLGRDLRLGRPAALKFLPAKVARKSSARAQLLQEAQAASALDHPNICTIYQIGETDDAQLYIAMAYYEGQTLSGLVRRGALNLERAYDITIQVAQGLAAAHRAGIVHRDVKPGNIMVMDDGRVKVLDFGIAQLADVEHALGDQVVGTIPYMSPEQLRKRPLDRRTDLWSLGIVFHYMLTGKKPFKGPNQKETRRAILRNSHWPVAGYGEEACARINKILGWLLAKDPDDRYGSAEELLVDLQRDGEPQGPGAEPDAASLAAEAFSHTGTVDLTSSTGGRPSVAVLPFRDMSPQGDQAHFAFGLAEELITLLSAVPGLRVVRIADHDAGSGHDTIARRLRVANALEGAVRFAAGRVRVTARMVQLEDGEVLWSEKYDREVAEVFDIEEDIAGRIASALEAPLLGDRLHTKRPGATDDVNLEAYDFYLKGRYRWNKRTEADMQKAIEYFEAAIDEEPGYARAHAGLADCFTLLGIYGIRPPSDVMPRAKLAAERALELDGQLAEAYTSRGCVRSCYNWDLVGASSDFRRAIELDPNYATAYQWFAMNALVPRRRFDEAFEELKRAARLQPTSLPVRTSMGLTAYYAGRYDEAVKHYRRVLELDGRFVLALVFLAHALGAGGRRQEALDVAARASELSEDRPQVTTTLGVLHAKLGHEEQAYSLADKLLNPRDGQFVPPTLVVQIYAALGEHEMALSVLDRALRQRTSDLVWLGVDPLYDSLRRLERFRQVLWDVGLETRP